MRRLLQLALLIALLPSLAKAQAWSGIIAPSRAINWTSAGVVGGIPSASWPQCGSTISAGASAATINSAIASCAANHFVLLGPGTFNLSTGLVMASNVELRGSGANSTFLVFTGNNNCNGDGGSDVCFMGENTYYGSPWVAPGGTQAANWTAGYAQGATSITLTSVGAAGLSIGQFIYLDQANDTPTNPSVNNTTGAIVADTTSPTDGISLEGGSPGRTVGGIDRNQIQIVQITGISGSTYTISPGLYAPNWTSAKSPGAWWAVTQLHNSGIANLSLDHTNGGAEFGTMFFNAFNCWYNNVRSIKANRDHIDFWQAAHITVQNSYGYGTINAMSQSYGVEHFISSDNAVVNSIFQQVTAPTIFGPAQGEAFLYNFAIHDTYFVADWMQQALAARHDAGANYNLFEGDVTSGIWNDVFHGSGYANTFFRTGNIGWEAGKTQETTPFQSFSYNRMDNILASVLGCNNATSAYPGPCGSPYHTTYQASSGVGATSIIFDLGAGNSETSTVVLPDPYVATSLMRWGNYDVVNAATRFVNSEVPSGLTDGFANPVPSSHTFPASFYYASTPAFWTGEPWPAIGPDVSGGNIPGYSGHAYEIPAQVCYLGPMGGPADGSGGVLAFDATTICNYGMGGGSPNISFSPPSVNYGTVPAAPLPPPCPTDCVSITLSNPGTASLTWTGMITISGSGAAFFTFNSNSCPFPGVLGAGGSCVMVVQFAPTSAGSQSAVINVNGTNISGMSYTVPLTGVGGSSIPMAPPSAPILVGAVLEAN